SSATARRRVGLRTIQNNSTFDIRCFLVSSTFMPPRSNLLRAATVAAAFVIALRIVPAVAQTKEEPAPIPFFPKGFGGNPEEFFEQMFGKSTPEEARELEAVKIPIRDEKEFGQPQVEAFLAQLKEQGLRVVRKGKEVDYLRHLVDTLRPFTKNPRRYDKI